MKFLSCAKFLFFLLCFIPLTIKSQDVTTLADVKANGGVTLDSVGNLYVAHFGPLPFTAGQNGKSIYKITEKGDVSLWSMAELNVGTGNHIDSKGFLYQGNFLGNRINKFNPDGSMANANFALISGPVGITIIENDTLVVCECNTNSVKKIAQDGTILTFVSGSFFNCANGISKDNNGNIYTTNFSDGRVTKIIKDGSATTLGSTPAGNGHITYRALDDMLYIASYSANRIYKMDMNGNTILMAGTGVAGAIDSSDPLSATFNKPNGIEISHDGCSLYITQDNDVIREIKFSDNGCITTTEDLINDENISLYPNPTKGELTFDSKEFNVISIQLLNMRGKVVLDIDNTDINTFDISTLKNGVYMVKFITEKKGIIVEKIALENQ